MKQRCLVLFKKIREVFSKFIEQFQYHVFTRDRLIKLLEDFKIELISNDVAFEVAESIVNEILNEFDRKNIRSREDLVKTLRGVIKSYFDKTIQIDLINEAREYDLYKIVFLGINGVGKTTTIAKIACLYRENGFKPLMVAADTFRAGAQEQLIIHSERTGIPVFTGRYGADPASVAFDAINYASKRGFSVILIDTAGRMHTDVDLIDELKKIIRVVKPHRRVLVVDALTGNDAIEQARFFHESIGVDCVIVTKVDAYDKGGVPLSIVYSIGKPVVMIGTGQGYKDLKYFNVNEFIDKIIS